MKSLTAKNIERLENTSFANAAMAMTLADLDGAVCHGHSICYRDPGTVCLATGPITDCNICGEMTCDVSVQTGVEGPGLNPSVISLLKLAFRNDD